MKIDLNIEKNYLDNAEQSALARGLYDIPIVDADCHYLGTPLNELAKYLDEPYKSQLSFIYGVKGTANVIPGDLGDRTNAGKLKSLPNFVKATKEKPIGEKMNPAVYPLIESSMKLAIDYNIVFPTDMLTLGLNPDPEMEVAIAYGFARWMTEEILPYDDSMKTMLYLPFSSPEACTQLIKEFGDKKGVVGFLVTSCRYQPVYHNSYMPVYKLLEEKGLPLGFHSVSNWQERPFQQLNRFLSSHALGFPLYNMIQMTNLIVNGIPERFPDLKFIFIEAGVAFIPFLMMRLDTDYLYRSSDAPLLTKRPSEYIRNFYFTSQPIEHAEDKHMETIFDMFDAENQLLYASDYPHQDFDTPATIYDLPFLSQTAKRKILGENALKLFNITNPVLHAKIRREQSIIQVSNQTSFSK